MRHMPTFDQNIEQPGMSQIVIPGGTFTFSAARPETLGAAEYTLSGVVTDVTGSLYGKEGIMQQMLVDIVDACKKHPRADNLLLRNTLFSTQFGGTNINEIHGWSPLSQIDISTFPDLHCDGMTNVIDASYEMIMSVVEYAKVLAQNDFDVNGIVFVQTDGMDNRSQRKMKDVVAAVESARRSEYLESMLILLIGVNSEDCKDWLEEFNSQCKFDDYNTIEDLDAQSAASFAGWVSSMTTSQSQSLGTGGPSQVLQF